MAAVEKVCLVCGKGFAWDAERYTGSQKVYCSKQCQHNRLSKRQRRKDKYKSKKWFGEKRCRCCNSAFAATKLMLYCSDICRIQARLTPEERDSRAHRKAFALAMKNPEFAQSIKETRMAKARQRYKSRYERDRDAILTKKRIRQRANHNDGKLFSQLQLLKQEFQKCQTKSQKDSATTSTPTPLIA